MRVYATSFCLFRFVSNSSIVLEPKVECIFFLLYQVSIQLKTDNFASDDFGKDNFENKSYFIRGSKALKKSVI